MDKTYYPITGIEAAYIAEDVIDTISGYSAGTPAYFAPSETAEWAEEQESTELFYDNKLQEVFYGLARSSIKLTISGIPADMDARIRGKNIIAATGRIAGSGDAEPPLCAFGLKINKGAGEYVYLWFPKGRFSGGTVTATTKNNGVTISTVEYTFTALETDKKFLLDGKEKGITWFKGDTTSPAFDDAGWFSQVQTPDTTSGTPDALTLDSSVPADDATGIAVDTNIVLTYNNKIASSAVTLLDATLTPVTVIKTLDGKILTIAPAANLTAEAEYMLIVSEVKDVYGQTLGSTVISFTTA